MSEIDKRNRLGGEPFTYQITKNGTVAINYKGKQINVVKGKDAERLIARIKAVENNTENNSDNQPPCKTTNKKLCLNPLNPRFWHSHIFID